MDFCTELAAQSWLESSRHLKDKNFGTICHKVQADSSAIQCLGQLVQEPVQVLIRLPLLLDLVD